MYSYQPYLSIGIVLVLFVGYSAIMRRVVAAANPAQRLGNIAQALGLQLGEGDPDLSIIIGPRQSLVLDLFGVTHYEARARAVGQAGPFACSFELHEKAFRVKLRRFTFHDNTQFHVELALQAPVPFPFEAWRPSAYGDGPMPRSGFPIVTQGQSPSGTWFLSSPDPRAAQWLGPAMNHLAQNAYHFHVIGTAGRLAMPFTKTDLSSACSQIVALRDELVRIASMFAGASSGRPM